MKLRNKKTGKVFDLECITVFERPGESLIGDSIDEFYTIAELNEEWEDYKPAEPLIKDEKVRKAVRVWANADLIKKAYLVDDYTMCANDDVNVRISFSLPVFKDVGSTNDYTIAELCGEEDK